VNQERIQQIEELYNEVLTLPAGKRTAFLDRACGNDTELRVELDSLLACESENGSCLDKPAIHFAAESLAKQGAGLLVGRMLGRYQLLSLVGRGGAGDVYCAVDSRLNRLVAVKILAPYLAGDLAWSQRFEQEARLIAALNHPHICILHDAGHDRGMYYLVFEYLVGEVLSDRLSRGALPLPQLLEYAIQIAEALLHAHQQDIVHHDLKPQNIMLVKTGAKLLDFGIAELRTPEGAASAFPPKDSVVGTLAYMAPEQIEGRETDARTDIYAFGVTMSEMLAARPGVPSDLDYLFLQPPPRFLGTVSLCDFVAQDLVGSCKRCGSALDSEFELVIRSLQVLLEAFALRDVTNVQEQCRLAEIFDAARANGDRDGPAFDGKTGAFEFIRGFRRVRDQTAATLRRHQCSDILSNDVFTCCSVQCGCRRIAIENIPVHVLDEDGIRRTFKKSLKKRFAVPRLHPRNCSKVGTKVRPVISPISGLTWIFPTPPECAASPVSAVGIKPGRQGAGLRFGRWRSSCIRFQRRQSDGPESRRPDTVCHNGRGLPSRDERP